MCAAYPAGGLLGIAVQRVSHFDLAGCGKGRVGHPEPVSFAGEGSAVRKKAKEKVDSEPRSKTERGSE